MRSPARFLQSSDPPRKAEPPSLLPVDSDVVVVLAALLCALICVIGLAIVARCAWIRRSSTSSSSSSTAGPPPPPSKGLKKKVLRALPTLSFDSSAAAAGGVELVECAICLTEFADGDDVRVLPQCGHGFHACCVDTWLRSHSSCPSCRRVLVVPAPPSRCHSCGATSDGAAAGAKAAERGGASTLSH